MWAIRLCLKVWLDLVSAFMTALLLVADVFGFTPPSSPYGVIQWRWFAVITFVVFCVLVYVRVFQLRALLEHRTRNRAIATKLAEFMRSGEQLQANAADAAQSVTLDDVQHWMEPIYIYLKQQCGDAYAVMFTQMDLRQPLVPVEGLATQEQRDVFVQVRFRLANLRTILERFI